MAIDFGLANLGGDPLDVLRAYGQARNDAVARQQQNAQLQQQRLQQVARPQIAQQVQSGNYEGARQAAVAVGDTDLATSIGALSTEHRQRLADEADILGRAAFSLKKLPAEQRTAAFASFAPELQARGFHPDELKSADLSDAGLDGYISLATTLKDQLDAQNEQRKPYTLGPLDQRFEGATKIAENTNQPPHFATLPDGTVMEIPGTSGAPPQPGASPSAGAQGGAPRRVNGYTPRVRDGGNNTDNVVDAKITNLAQGVGVDPDTPLTPAQVQKLALAIPYTEGAAGSLADRNNNPGNIQNGPFAKSQPGYAGVGEGGYAKFTDKASGQAAVGALLDRYYARGQRTVRDIIEGKPVAAPQGAKPQGGRSAPIIYGTPKPDTEMTPAAIDNAARVYNMTGQIPPSLGRGGRVQQQILSRAAVLQGGEDTGTMVAERAGRKADTAALATLQRQASQVYAFESTATRNGALALNLSQQVGNGNVPLFNAWVNAGRQGTGDPKISAFNAATETFATEYAKVVSGATGGAITSDSAREHARSLINTAQSPQQFASTIHTLQIDMENRRRGLEDQRTELMHRISGVPRGTNGPVQVHSPAEARALPSGTPFIDEHGVPRVRK